MKALLAVIALSSLATPAFARTVCFARPQPNISDIAGIGHGANKAQATSDALAKCRSKAPARAARSCKVESCY